MENQRNTVQVSVVKDSIIVSTIIGEGNEQEEIEIAGPNIAIKYHWGIIQLCSVAGISTIVKTEFGEVKSSLTVGTNIIITIMTSQENCISKFYFVDGQIDVAITAHQGTHIQRFCLIGGIIIMTHDINDAQTCLRFLATAPTPLSLPFTPCPIVQLPIITHSASMAERADMAEQANTAQQANMAQQDGIAQRANMAHLAITTHSAKMAQQVNIFQNTTPQEEVNQANSENCETLKGDIVNRPEIGLENNFKIGDFIIEGAGIDGSKIEGAGVNKEPRIESNIGEL